MDEDLDIDEIPNIQHVNRIKINHTTENSITRANEMNIKMFEGLNTMSPQGVFNITASSNVKIYMNNRANTKSSDCTPLINARRNTATENNSVIA